MSHQGAGVPDQQGVRTILEVHVRHQGKRILTFFVIFKTFSDDTEIGTNENSLIILLK